MAHQRQEAGIETALFALEHLVDAGLEVVVDALAGHAAPVVKGRIVGGKQHLLGFVGKHHNEGLAAVGEAKMGCLDPLHHAADLHLFLAPVKLIGFPSRERQGDKGRHFGRQLFIVTDEALDAVIGTLVAQAW